MSIVFRKLVGSSALLILSVGLAAAFLVLWPRPVSVILAGTSLLCFFGALLALCGAAKPEYAPQAQKAIFLTSGCFGLAFAGLAWKYRASAPAFSSPYGDKRVVVLSSRPVDLSGVREGVVEQMAGPPAEILSNLAASGAHHIYVDGGITIQGFLRAGLIQRLIITRVPVLIRDGIPLFGTLPRDVRIRHVATQHYPSGLVKSEYHVTS